MDLTFLSAALKESLFQAQSVVLPGIGTFTITEVPSAFINGGKTLTPPAREITFSTMQMANDGELEAIFARIAELSQEEAAAKMIFLIEKIRTSLHENRQACIPEFGTIRLDSEYQFHFIPDTDYCFCPDYCLLDPLPLKPEEGETEILPELATADTLVSIDENPLETDVWIIKDGEPQPEAENIPETQHPATGTPVTSRKWLWITLSILGTLLLACVLIYLFRTELTPILEKFLYTREELELLRQTGFSTT